MFELDFGGGEKRMCVSGIAVIETVNWLIFAAKSCYLRYKESKSKKVTWDFRAIR